MRYKNRQQKVLEILISLEPEQLVRLYLTLQRPSASLSPGATFGSRSYVLEHHRPSESSASHKRFPVSVFSKTKQIVKLPLRRHDQFHNIQTGGGASELPSKPSNPIKIKVSKMGHHPRSPTCPWTPCPWL